MPRSATPTKYCVQIVEYEQGWGSKVDETIYFEYREEAIQFAVDYNKKYNNEKTVPSWYMVAQYIERID